MRPHRVHMPEDRLAELRSRVAGTRLPPQLPGERWDRGVPLDYLSSLARHWSKDYDWRALEDRLNAYPQFVTEIEGLDIHFLHVRSPIASATPLLLTHGWPGSVADFLDVIAPLCNPAADGGDAQPAFHLVIPSLPGFGFSGAPTTPGWGVEKTAQAWAQLMARLGYDRYVAQGGDLGAAVTLLLAAMDAPHVLGAHVNFLVTPPVPDVEMSPEAAERVAGLHRFATDGAGYMAIQATRPQTLAYALTDSPVGQLAWLVEKYFAWSQSTTDPEDALTRDQILDTATLYWLTGTAGTAANFYYEMADFLPTAATPPPAPPPLHTPLGVAVYAHDSALAVRAFAEPLYPNIVQWSEFAQGGHFPALEQPEYFVRDLRNFATALRRTTVIPAAA